MVKKIRQILLLMTTILLVGCSSTDASDSTSSSVTKSSKSIKKSSAKTSSSSSQSSSQPIVDSNYEALANKDYQGTQQIVVNNNDPAFTDLNNTTPWQKYYDLDKLNRAVKAEGLLDKSLMPKAKRQPLVWDPTGWHNKKLPTGKYLYNRCHLIGYQFTGQNNNPKNLMTGTMSLNDPEMSDHENTIAKYLKADPNHKVRYAVQPVYRGDELVARGVWMRAQSIGNDDIKFNVYIFNVQPNVSIDYQTGYSKITQNAQQASSTPSPSVSSSSTSSSQAPSSSNDQIWGNKRSMIYHIPGQESYNTGKAENKVWFNSEQEAQQAGFHRAKR